MAVDQFRCGFDPALDTVTAGLRQAVGRSLARPGNLEPAARARHQPQTDEAVSPSGRLEFLKPGWPPPEPGGKIAASATPATVRALLYHVYHLSAARLPTGPPLFGVSFSTSWVLSARLQGRRVSDAKQLE